MSVPVNRRLSTILVGSVGLCALWLTLASPAPAQAAEAFVGVDNDDQLVTFRSDRPRAARRRSISGLASGERILGLDLRPASLEVYAVTSASRLYKLDVQAARVIPVGSDPFSPALEGSSVGFDFNPTVDRIRLITNTGQNLRLNPDNGAVAATDGRLQYASDDSGNGRTGIGVAAGYTNSVRGAMSTTLYDLDTARDVLAIQNPPNNGTLRTVGSLGVNAASPVSFDLTGDNTAYAVMRVARRRGSTLYRIDLMTGRATSLGQIRGQTVRAMAVRGTIP